MNGSASLSNENVIAYADISGGVRFLDIYGAFADGDRQTAIAMGTLNFLEKFPSNLKLKLLWNNDSLLVWADGWNNIAIMNYHKRTIQYFEAFSKILDTCRLPSATLLPGCHGFALIADDKRLYILNQSSSDGPFKLKIHTISSIPNEINLLNNRCKLTLKEEVILFCIFEDPSTFVLIGQIVFEGTTLLALNRATTTNKESSAITLGDTILSLSRWRDAVYLIDVHINDLELQIFVTDNSKSQNVSFWLKKINLLNGTVSSKNQIQLDSKANYSLIAIQDEGKIYLSDNAQLWLVTDDDCIGKTIGKVSEMNTAGFADCLTDWTFCINNQLICLIKDGIVHYKELGMSKKLVPELITEMPLTIRKAHQFATFTELSLLLETNPLLAWFCYFYYRLNHFYETCIASTIDLGKTLGLLTNLIHSTGMMDETIKIDFKLDLIESLKDLVIEVINHLKNSTKRTFILQKAIQVASINHRVITVVLLIRSYRQALTELVEKYTKTSNMVSLANYFSKISLELVDTIGDFNLDSYLSAVKSTVIMPSLNIDSIFNIDFDNNPLMANDDKDETFSSITLPTIDPISGVAITDDRPLLNNSCNRCNSRYIDPFYYASELPVIPFWHYHYSYCCPCGRGSTFFKNKNIL